MSGVSFKRLALACTSFSTLRRVERRVAAQREHEARRPELVAERAERAHQRLVDHHLAEQLRLLGERAVAILELGQRGAHVVLVARLREAPVEVEALAGVGHVVVGEKGRHVDGDLRIVLAA